MRNRPGGRLGEQRSRFQVRRAVEAFKEHLHECSIRSAGRTLSPMRNLATKPPVVEAAGVGESQDD
jgi:hypothetical protein